MIIQRTPVPILIQSCYHQFSNISILGQSMSNQVPIHYQSVGKYPFPPKHIYANHYQFVPVLSNPGQSDANPIQSNANPRPVTRTICPHNLGTSALYGMVPGLLGEWIWHKCTDESSSNNPTIKSHPKTTYQTALAVHWQCIGLGLARALPIPSHHWGHLSR